MNPKDASILVIDGGQFFSLAKRLAPDFKKVYFGRINDPCYPVPGPFAIGDGFDGVSQVHDPFSVIRKVDAVVIPDVGLAPLQRMLKSFNVPVWGSHDGDVLELDRVALKEFCSQKGLENPKYQIITGIKALRARFETGRECYVKISKFRGLTETHHFQSKEESRAWLDHIATKLGPAQDIWEFIVEEPIESKIETGIDAPFFKYWPQTVLHAVEAKDKGCISAVTKWDDLPEQVKEIAGVLEDYLPNEDYCNFASFEARIDKQGVAYLTDFTARLATPCGEPMLVQIKNLAEIILAGALGEDIPEPNYDKPFAAQALIDCDGDEEQWRAVRIPVEAQKDIFLYAPVQTDDDLFEFPPMPWSTETIGSIVKNGDTIKQAVDGVKAIAEMIPHLTVKMEGIQAALAEVIEMEKEDVPFTDAPIPKPEIAVT